MRERWPVGCSRGCSNQKVARGVGVGGVEMGGRRGGTGERRLSSSANQLVVEQRLPHSAPP